MSDADWQRVAALGELAPGVPRGVKVGDKDVVLVAHEGAVYALDGVCPHAYALMSDGYMNGVEIECPLHAACFDIRTGKLIVGPLGTDDLATWEVKVEGSDVWVKAKAQGG